MLQNSCNILWNDAICCEMFQYIENVAKCFDMLQNITKSYKYVLKCCKMFYNGLMF